MLCEKCKNRKPTVFFTDPGGVNHSLCAFCASSFNHAQTVTEDPAPEVIFSPESIAVSNISFKIPLPTDRGLVCETCLSSGAVGCVNCAENILKNRASTQRMPRRVRVERERTQNIAGLKKRLDESLSREDYEGAANIRDQIRKLQAAK